MAITIRPGTVAEVYALYEQTPEFAQQAQAQEDVQQRLSGESAIVLVAERNNEAVGFKVGYDRYSDGSFYSWLGAVLPNARRKGVAGALLAEQERLVTAVGFDRVYVKTRNRYVAMLSLLLERGYVIVGVKLSDDLPLADGRITLVKLLRA